MSENTESVFAPDPVVILTYSYLTNGPNKLVLHNNRLERLVMDKPSSLLVPFKSSKANEGLELLSLVPILKFTDTLGLIGYECLPLVIFSGLSLDKCE